MDLSVLLHGPRSGHSQSHLDIRRQFIIRLVGGRCDFGTSSRTATNVIIVRCVIRVSPLESDGSESMRITAQKFDSWHSRLVRPNHMVSTHMNRHLSVDSS